MEQNLRIPNDALRIRVIPNSNDEEDQLIKNKVKVKMQNIMYNLLKDAKSTEDARKIINDNLDNIDNEVGTLLLTEGYNQKYNINYGYNYFPEKNYKGVTYEEGYYESLVIKLGSGKGDNWWCVLYPPLCLIEEDNENYKSLIEEILNKYF
jgi:stage II sporulation protein R